MKKHVISVKTRQSKTVQMTPAEVAAFQAAQDTPAQHAAKIRARELAEKQRLARAAWEQDQMSKRAADPDAPQELKDWLTAKGK